MSQFATVNNADVEAIIEDKNPVNTKKAMAYVLCFITDCQKSKKKYMLSRN